MHLVPLIQDRGFSAEQASSVAFLMLSVAILGRIAFGKLADMIGALPAYLVASFWQTALVFFFTTFASLNGFYESEKLAAMTGLTGVREVPADPSWKCRGDCFQGQDCPGYLFDVIVTHSPHTGCRYVRLLI